MMRSLSSAVGALRNHQIYVDVIAANIANVNTTGFKASRVTFQAVLSQTLRYARAPQVTSTLGGLNPMQVGLGVRLSGIDTIFTQGSLEATGRPSDLAIEGDGFFILSDGEANYYTRDGILDSWNSTLVHVSTGMAVQGWQAADDGTVDVTQPISSISIPFGRTVQASATTSVSFEGNLDAGAATSDTLQGSMSIYDSLGNLHNITLTFTKTGVNQWTWLATTTDTGLTIAPATATTITFESDGTYSDTNPDAVLTITYTNGATTPATVDLDLTQITQVGHTGGVSVADQDGMPPGTLLAFGVDEGGLVTGIYSNGVQQTLGQIALARFMNPSGLMTVGRSLFIESANSGLAQTGSGSGQGYGNLASGYLEMANVDLAQEFVNMIAALRGFQANSRVISATDEMIQELINLRR